MEGLRWRTIIATLGVVISIVYVLPNFTKVGEISWWPAKQKLNYGLDIQGGLQLVMGVDVEGVVKESITRTIASLKADLPKEGVSVVDVKSSAPETGTIEVMTASKGDSTKAEKYFADKFATTFQVIESNDNMVKVRYLDTYMTDYKNRVIQQSIETIRNRIDEFGVAEPSISQQGSDRILIQLPGMADSARAKELINTTAKLDFMIVSTEMSQEQLFNLVTEAEKTTGVSLANTKYSEYVTKINEAIRSKLPEKTVVYFQKAENATSMETGALPFLLKTDTDLGGNSLDDAHVGYDQYGVPQVQLQFNAAGATKFANLTGANINRSMAIVLDKVVKSAPNIQDRIAGGSAVITLGGGRDRESSMNEAKMISTSLRAGALPAALEQLEERSVGPTLGADALDKALLGTWVGALVTLIFMVAYYKSMGVVSAICLVLSIVSSFALLSILGATLTLPGIAGIALTIGTAVDANVLINERIRDELKKGASVKAAIQEGYNLAMSAILDSNITTGITAIILLYLGTGPVRGFAVTLLIGIVTSMFINVFVSKVIVDNLVYKFNLKKLSV